MINHRDNIKYNAVRNHCKAARAELDKAIEELERLRELNGGKPLAHELITLDIALLRTAREHILDMR